MSSIYIYAELLLHIRQVAVLAILPSAANSTTHIGISADSKTLSLEHEGQRAITELPCPVLGIANRREDTSQQELSFRLQPSAAARLPTPGKLPSGDVPWSASALSPNTQIACKACRRLLTRPVQAWKDLPSGGWAEMMELWHCHKPTVPGSDGSSSSSVKGYAASNAIGPSPGTVLVDIGHFVLAEDDCIGIQQKRDPENLLACAGCKEPVGIEDKATAGCVRLFKWSLALHSPERRLSKMMTAFQRSKDHWKTHSVACIFSAQLIALIEELAIYKFLLYSGPIEEAKDSLLVWVFTPDLIYSCSEEAGEPRRAMKIFYRIISEHANMSDYSSDPKVEEYRLPEYIIQQILLDLKTSTKVLPQSAQHHQGWMIGLLDR